MIACAAAGFGLSRLLSSPQSQGSPLEAGARSGSFGSGGRVFFVSPAVGWALDTVAGAPYAEQVLYRTDDGGTSWQRQLSWKDAYAPLSERFFSAQQGVLVVPTVAGGRRLYATSNGTDWRATEGPAPASALSFIDSRTGWAVYQREGSLQISRTLDGGSTWQPVTALGSPGSVRSRVWIQFLNQSDGLLGWGVEGGLAEPLVTHDGGRTWNRAGWSPPSPPPAGDGSSLATSVQQVGARSIFVRLEAYPRAAFRPSASWLYYSGDAGRSWSGARSIPGLYWTVIDSHHLVAAQASTLLSSADGGRTWSPQEVRLPALEGSAVIGSAAQFAGLEFSDRLHGWSSITAFERCSPSVGAGSCQEHPRSASSTIRTGDGGATWLIVRVG